MLLKIPCVDFIIKSKLSQYSAEQNEAGECVQRYEIKGEVISERSLPPMQSPYITHHFNSSTRIKAGPTICTTHIQLQVGRVVRDGDEPLRKKHVLRVRVVQQLGPLRAVQREVPWSWGAVHLEGHVGDEGRPFRGSVQPRVADERRGAAGHEGRLLHPAWLRRKEIGDEIVFEEIVCGSVGFLKINKL